MAEEEKIPAAEPDVRSALGLEFAKAPLDLGSRTFDARLAAGSLTLVDRNASLPSLRLGLDMRNLAIDERVTLPARQPPRAWDGAPPQATIQWKGPLASPARNVDAASLGNALSARAIARETARVEALQADIRERAFFNRRMKGLEFLRQRDREIAAYEAEQARLAAEEAKRAADEKRQAEEDKRKADEQARLAREQQQHARELAEQAQKDRARVREIIQQRSAPLPRAATSQPIAPPPALVVPGAIDPSAAGRY
jgi:hypothetical protein